MNGTDQETNNGEFSAQRTDEDYVLSLLLNLSRRRATIVKSVVMFALLGLTYAVVAPVKYTASERVIPEASEKTGGLPGGVAGLQGLGINLGGQGSGLTVDSYPAILSTREVRLAVARDTFHFPDRGGRMTVVDYAARPDGILEQIGTFLYGYTVGIPGRIMATVQGAGESDEDASADSSANDFPTEDEEKAISLLGGYLSSSMDPKSGIMTVRVKAYDPELAAALTDAFVKRMSAQVQELRTKKARENVNFIEARFEDARQQLRSAEEQLAEFEDRNQGQKTASLRTRRDQLQRQVSFASQLYNDLQKQLTQARIELQKSEPVITVVEESVPPRYRSEPARKLIVILFTLLGGLFGVGIALVRSYLDAKRKDDKTREKIEELQEKLTPSFRQDWVRKIMKI